MDKNFNEKSEIEEVACNILMDILDIPNPPWYLSERHKQNSEYCDGFEKEFIKGLNYEQRKDYNSLMSAKILTSTAWNANKSRTR